MPGTGLEKTMIRFIKRAFDAYVAGAGSYPLPMTWTF